MAQPKATGKAAPRAKLTKSLRTASGRVHEQPAEGDEGIGEELELVLSDELGGGDSFMPVSLPAGRYEIAGGVVAWPVRRSEDGNFDALFPMQTLLGLEAKHESRLVRRVNWGPESRDWTVVEIDGIAVLVRPGDLSAYNECEHVEF